MHGLLRYFHGMQGFTMIFFVFWEKRSNSLYQRTRTSLGEDAPCRTGRARHR